MMEKDNQKEEGWENRNFTLKVDSKKKGCLESIVVISAILSLFLFCPFYIYFASLQMASL